MFSFIHQVFAKGVDPDTVVLMAARASRTENQDAIDSAIVGTLADPKEVTCLRNCFLCGLFLIILQLISSFLPHSNRHELVFEKCISFLSIPLISEQH